MYLFQLQIYAAGKVAESICPLQILFLSSHLVSQQYFLKFLRWGPELIFLGAHFEDWRIDSI